MKFKRENFDQSIIDEGYIFSKGNSYLEIRIWKISSFSFFSSRKHFISEEMDVKLIFVTS